MPKQIIVIMQGHYPFGQCQEVTNQNTRVLVRRIYQVSVMQRNRLLQKVGVLRRLKNQFMIKIESVLEEQQSIHFLLEYVPIKLQTWISNINDEFIQNFRDQLIKFSSFLANSSIKIDFKLQNIGMDKEYKAKYFLDLDFEVDHIISKQKLKFNYIRQITNLFKPYLSQAPPVSRPSDSQVQKKSARNQPAVSPPTNKNSNKSKDILEKYYQEVNMSVDSENQKILQEFMDVLDNQENQEKMTQSTPLVNLQSGIALVKTQSNGPNKVQQNKLGNTHNNFNKSRQPDQTNQQIPKNQHAAKPIDKKETHFSDKKQVQEASKVNKNANQQNSNNKNYNRKQQQKLQQPQESRPSRQFAYKNNNQGEVQDKLRTTGESMIRYKQQSAQLQNRVKSAIQKSMDAIKKFKSLKDSLIT